MFDISAYLGSLMIDTMKIHYCLFTIDKDKMDDPLFIIDYKNKVNLQDKLDNIGNLDDKWKNFFLSVLKSLKEDAYPVRLPNSDFYLQIVILNDEYRNKEVDKHIIKGVLVDASDLNKIHVRYKLEELL